MRLFDENVAMTEFGASLKLRTPAMFALKLCCLRRQSKSRTPGHSDPLSTIDSISARTDQPQHFIDHSSLRDIAKRKRSESSLPGPIAGRLVLSPDATSRRPGNSARLLVISLFIRMLRTSSY